MLTANELYAQAVAAMPASEQLRLATIILEGLNAAGVLDYSDHWSDEDIRDLTVLSMSHGMNAVGEE